MRPIATSGASQEALFGWDLQLGTSGLLYSRRVREGGRVAAYSSHSFWHPILLDGSGIVDFWLCSLTSSGYLCRSGHTHTHTYTHTHAHTHTHSHKYIQGGAYSFLMRLGEGVPGGTRSRREVGGKGEGEREYLQQCERRLQWWAGHSPVSDPLSQLRSSEL